MPRQSKQTREEELLAHALEFFSKEGFRETSLQEIADRLGITRPLFYYYFESKEELLWRLIGNLGDSLLNRARPLAESEDLPLVKLEKILSSHIETLLENAAAFRVYLAERHLVDGKRDRRLKRGENAYFTLLTDIIEEGQRRGEIREGNPQAIARLGQGTANSLLRWYVADGVIPAKEIIALTAEVFVDGIATPPARKRRRAERTSEVVA